MSLLPHIPDSQTKKKLLQNPTLALVINHKIKQKE